MLWGWSWSVGTTYDSTTRCAKKEKCCPSLWLLRCGCVLLAVGRCGCDVLGGTRRELASFPAFGGLDGYTAVLRLRFYNAARWRL
eukprot:2359103-Prymnesium_polylepis.1